MNLAGAVLTILAWIGFACGIAGLIYLALNWPRSQRLSDLSADDISRLGDVHEITVLHFEQPRGD